MGARIIGLGVQIEPDWPSLHLTKGVQLYFSMNRLKTSKNVMATFEVLCKRPKPT